MNSGRLLLFGLLGAVVAVLLAAGAALDARVQTWGAQRWLAGRPALGLTLGRLDAGLNRVRVEDARIVRAGAVLTLPAAEAELPVFAAAWHRQFLIRRLVARGWTLDLTAAHAAPAAVTPAPAVAREFSLLTTAYADEGATPVVAAAAPAVFTGIFHALRLPVDCSLDGLDLAGEVLLPKGPDRPAARIAITFTGGGLAAGRPGRFDYTAVVTFAGDDVAVRELTVHGTLGVIMDSPRSVSRFVVSTQANALGPKFPGGVQLALDVSAQRAANGETYAVSVSSGEKQLAALETVYPAGASHLAGNWRLDMRDTDLAPFAFGEALPSFTAAGEGRFDLDTTFAELRASGRLNATVDRLSVIHEQLAGLGAVHLTADFDFAQRAGATRVDRLDVTVEGARPVATVQALQAFEFNLRTGELNVADPAKDLLGVRLQGLPLAWVGLPLAQLGYRARGDDLQGEFVASARNGGFALRPKSPLTLTHLDLAWTDGRRLLSGVDVSLALAADYTPQGWQLELRPFTLRRQDITLLTVEGRVGQLAGPHQPVKAAGKWSGQLPALCAQPGALGADLFTTGAAQGDFAANLDDKREFQFRAALSNLAAPSAPALPAVSVDLRLDLARDGAVTFSVPVRLERDGRQSDLTVTGTARPQTAGWALDARVTGDFLALEDAQLLAAPFAGTAGTAAPVLSPRGPAPAAPAWGGVSGQVALALQRVAYRGQLQVTGLTGQLRLDAASLQLVDVHAGFDADSDVRLAGRVTYQAGQPQQYALAADFALRNFATAPAFRAIDATKPPTVEARIDLTSRLVGSGASLGDLAAGTHGDLVITSKGGIFRGLSADLTDRIQKTQSRVTAIASFLGVVPDDYVNKTRILGDIARALAEVPFDQLSVTATRDAALNLQLKDFSLISPEIRIGGVGTVRQIDGVPLLAQPLDMQLSLAARGKLGDLIRRAGLLEKTQDSLGYAPFAVPLHIGGTLGNPDTNDIRTALLNSALERSGLLDSLMGK